MSAVEPLVEANDVRRALRASGLLRAFNEAGVLSAADVHVALRLGRLAGEAGEDVLLAAALAVRAPRLASVCVDLATAPTTVASDVEAPVDLQALPWPGERSWLAALAASPLVAAGDESADERPLRLVGSTLYLDRYWREERQVAADLIARGASLAPDIDESLLELGLSRLFDEDGDALQRRAVETALRRRLAVIAGGPGTGKTTTITRVLLVLDEQAAGRGARAPVVALAAPTGKAAARLQEAVHEQALALPIDAGEKARLLALRASTLHRLLGWRPDSGSRFRHDRTNQLPHDVVVVDETSMVSLSLMARLVEAVRGGARLVLAGDPQQLASVEAGAVLSDVVGPADQPQPPPGPLRESIVVLRRGYRFSGGIATLAEAILSGDEAAAIEVLRTGAGGVRWIEADIAEVAGREELAPVREAAVAAGRTLVEAGRAGDGRAGLDALATFRVLCAHRRGPYGARTWNATVEAWLGSGVAGFGADAWYAGRPLLMNENDYTLRLYNGDTGVVVARVDGTPTAVFEREGGIVEISPTRLGDVQTVYAMTVHRSQGSQLDEVAVLLPDPSSPILTRELLYTAVTRARTRVTVCATEEALRAGIARRAARASGLRARLWPG
jgi:exodeoxyribonuclease V alpha subunit